MPTPIIKNDSSDSNLHNSSSLDPTAPENVTREPGGTPDGSQTVGLVESMRRGEGEAQDNG